MNSSLPFPVRMESVDVLLFSTIERQLQVLHEQNPPLMVSPSTSRQPAGAEGLFSLCLLKTIVAGLVPELLGNELVWFWNYINSQVC